MYLTIVLRKEVPDEATAQAIVNLVAEKIEDQPDIAMKAQVNSQMIIPKP